MAVFRRDPDNYQRLDFQLLQNGFVALYYRQEILDEDVAQLKNLDYEIVFFDCRCWRSEVEMHQDFAEKLNFPDYFGKNLNALRDCLSDLEISDEGGKVLVFKNFDSFSSDDSDLACEMLDIIAGESRYHLLYGKRMITLVQSNNPKIDADLKYPWLGAMQAGWNPKEWLNERRGLA